MWRLLLLFSVIPIALAFAARWWFGMRVLGEYGGRPCRCDITRWAPLAKAPEVILREEESAHEFGRQLWLKALEEWRTDDPKGAASRLSAKRFGMAVPPLSGIVAAMAVVVAKIPAMGSIAVFLAATALSAVFGALSLAGELAAINRAARKMRDARAFARRDDEESVIRCAMAHAWVDTFPPIFGLVQR